MRSAAGHATSPNAGPPQQSSWALESCMPHFTSRGTEGEVSSVDRWLTKGREFFLLFGDQIRLAAPLILGCEQGRLIMNGLQPDGPSPFCPRFARRKPASFRQTHLSLAGICNHVCEILDICGGRQSGYTPVKKAALPNRPIFSDHLSISSLSSKFSIRRSDCQTKVSS